MSIEDRYELFDNPSDSLVPEAVWISREETDEWPTWDEARSSLADFPSMQAYEEVERMAEAETRILTAIAEGEVRAFIEEQDWRISLTEEATAGIERRNIYIHKEERELASIRPGPVVFDRPPLSFSTGVLNCTRLAASTTRKSPSYIAVIAFLARSRDTTRVARGSNIDYYIDVVRSYTFAVVRMKLIKNQWIATKLSCSLDEKDTRGCGLSGPGITRYAMRLTRA